MFTNQKDFMMFYHTSVRNIGLFISLSFVSLGAKTKSKLIPLKLLSLIFSSASIFVNYNLIKEYETFKLTNKHDIVERWMKLPKFVIVANTLLFFVVLYRILIHLDIY